MNKESGADHQQRLFVALITNSERINWQKNPTYTAQSNETTVIRQSTDWFGFETARTASSSFSIRKKKCGVGSNIEHYWEIKDKEKEKKIVNELNVFKRKELTKGGGGEKSETFER